MINVIIKLEDMLKMSGYEDWEIIYLPDEDGYVLKLDGDAIFMFNLNRDMAELREGAGNESVS